jgi:2-iminobutanoate/2-iminopropanoate deaminase
VSTDRYKGDSGNPGEKMKRKIESQDAPAAIGPYSQAIECNGTVYVSGQIPIDRKTGQFAGTDIAAQTEQSIRNIEMILKAADLSLSSVVMVTVLLADINDFKAMNEVYARHFTADFPARAAFQVAALPMNALVEIEAVAVRE